MFNNAFLSHGRDAHNQNADSEKFRQAKNKIFRYTSFTIVSEKLRLFPSKDSTYRLLLFTNAMSFSTTELYCLK